jgi:hypothetical protein
MPIKIPASIPSSRITEPTPIISDPIIHFSPVLVIERRLD